jgi:hypothetical protein
MAVPPTHISGVHEYLEEIMRDAEGGGDLVTLQRGLESSRHELMRLGLNDYQRELVLGAINAVRNYMSKAMLSRPDQRRPVLLTLERLRNVSNFGPRQ